MKKMYLFILATFLVQYFSAQKNTEMKGLAAKEGKSFANKMISGNINPNTLNYDLQYERMDVRLDPTMKKISGSVTAHFKTSQSMSTIYFDMLIYLTAFQIEYHGTPLDQTAFKQLYTNELKIDLPTPLAANVVDSLTIRYFGAPPSSFTLASDIMYDKPALGTFSEPYGAQEWFPTKQSLNDKIDRFDFKITTPAEYSVAANGKLMSETILPNGEKLTFWRTTYPMAAYLTGLVVTDFVKLNDTIGNPPFPFVNYLFPSTANDPLIMANIEWTKEAMILFETHFGPYPFRNEKYGHMELIGAMEHQTMSTIGKGSWNKATVAHELTHQWFGNKITCGAWNDMWLNEGFAVFGVHLANEKLLMSNTQFLEYLIEQRDEITNLPGGSTYITDADLDDTSAIFNPRLVYAKGGYIVRMLKWILGDDAFYSAMRDYLTRPNLAYGYARTADLNASLLQSTGKDFTEFFNDWVYGEGYPIYDIKWKQVGNQVSFKASQTQSHSSVSFFEMPLPIKVTGTGGETAYFALNNSSNNQYFTESVSFPVASVQFNYEYQMLEKNSKVAQDNTLSTKDLIKNQFSLFPNPAKNELYVKGIDKPIEYSIHFVDGKLVKKDKYQPNKSINISELIPGTYILTIKEKKIKFIKY